MQIENSDELMCYEHNGIGTRNESYLHMGIKKWYSKPGDRFEVKVDGNVIDIVRGELLIEIQTKNFGAMKGKLNKLLDKYQIVVVHPIAIQKWIVTTNADGEEIRRRKSTRKGKLTDVFNELISIPELVNHDNFTLEVLMTIEEELRCDDGRGSWRRKGISIVNRSLISVEQIHTFYNKSDLLGFLPIPEDHPFTNKELSAALGIKTTEAQKITYCLKRIGLIEPCGKRSRELLYMISKRD